MITIYSTPNCANCNSLKQIYKANGIDYEEKTIGVDIQKEALEEMSGTQLRAAPVVFRDDVYVGGIGEGMLLVNTVRAEKAEDVKAQMVEELKSLGVTLL